MKLGLLLALILVRRPLSRIQIQQASARSTFLAMPRAAKRLLTSGDAISASATTTASNGVNDADGTDSAVDLLPTSKKPRAAKAQGNHALSKAKDKEGRGDNEVSPSAAAAVNATKEETGQAEGEKLSRRETMSKVDAHPRDLILPVDLPSSMEFIKIMTWNVNGFKALMSNKLSVFTSLIAKHQPDIVCLQETKLQSNALDGLSDVLPGYDAFWHCSTEKKGYSGTAMFIRRSVFQYEKEVIAPGSNSASAPMLGTGKATAAKKQSTLSSMWAKKDFGKEEGEGKEAPAAPQALPEDKAPPRSTTAIVKKISFDFGEKKFAGEGRVMTLETDRFFVVGAYIPNSGEGLVRLKYRVEEWDPAFFAYLRTLRASKPVILTGDLNVGHLDLDIHNPTAKHIVKQAGLTPQERNSFSELLDTKTFRDAFRYLYPNAIGQFTYWSQRTFARPVNRGIRLDYFICSESMFSTDTDQAEQTLQEAASATRREVNIKDVPVPGVADCYILHEDTVGVSDHCPVVLVVRVA